jgi:serine/threonine protein kinase
MPDDDRTRSNLVLGDVTGFDVDPPYELQINEIIDGFKILSEERRGGFGVLFKASKDGQSFAVKQLLPKYASNAEQQRRLQREAFLNQHPERPDCVCRLEQDCSGTVRRFIILNWLDGQTLAERFGQCPVHSEQLVHLSIQVAGLLTKLHSRGYLHRDFHFGNVMILADGSLAVLDLGLSSAPRLPMPKEVVHQLRDISQDQLKLGLNQFQSPPGLLQVLHPGFYDGLEPQEERDVYALGCQLYRFATGYYPYERCDCRDSDGNHFGTLASKQPQHVPPPLPATTPPTFVDLVQRLLDWKSASYPTVGEVLQQLVSILAVQHRVPLGHPGPEPVVVLQHAAIRRFVIDLEKLQSELLRIAENFLPLHYSGASKGSRVGTLLKTIFQHFWLSSLHDLKHLKVCTKLLPSGTSVRAMILIIENEILLWQQQTYSRLRRNTLNRHPATALKKMQQRFESFLSLLRQHAHDFNNLSGQAEAQSSVLRDVF